MTQEISFVVYGIAQGKGSTNSRFVPSLGRTIQHEPPHKKAWQALVQEMAQQHVPPGGLLDGPLAASVMFYLPRPRSAPKKRRVFASKKPDLDKLLRAVMDAMTGIIYTDDARVVWFERLGKDYGDPPRVEIRIRPVMDEDLDAARARSPKSRNTALAGGAPWSSG